MLNRQGINYENSAICEEILVISDPVMRRTPESSGNQRPAGSRGCLNHALHGRASAQRRRPAARSVETSARPILEET